MIADDINIFISGAIFMGLIVAAMFFGRFWAKTRERLFAWFAAAFAVLAVERIVLFWYVAGHVHPAVYTLRLVAFVFIIAGVVDRNRRGP
jgi:hypothetical protein